MKLRRVKQTVYNIRKGCLCKGCHLNEVDLCVFENSKMLKSCGSCVVSFRGYDIDYIFIKEEENETQPE